MQELAAREKEGRKGESIERDDSEISGGIKAADLFWSTGPLVSDSLNEKPSPHCRKALRQDTPHSEPKLKWDRRRWPRTRDRTILTKKYGKKNNKKNIKKIYKKIQKNT